MIILIYVLVFIHRLINVPSNGGQRKEEQGQLSWSRLRISHLSAWVWFEGAPFIESWLCTCTTRQVSKMLEQPPFYCPGGNCDIHRHFAEGLMSLVLATPPPVSWLKELPVVCMFPNSNFLLSKHALGDSSRPAFWQSWLRHSVLFQHQCIFQPDWGHKLNGLVHSIKWRLVWLGSCPKHNILTSTAGVFLQEFERRWKCAYFFFFRFFFSWTDSQGRKCLERKHFRCNTS